MTTEPTGTGDAERESSWLWNHIGRLTGLFLAVIALAFVALLAFLGFRPAEGILVFVIVGLVMLALGGRLHGL